MNVQQYVNLASALIILVGGLLIVFVYPGQMRGEFRVLIGLFVAFYFLARMGHTILVIRRDRLMKDKGLKHLIEESDDESGNPKRP